MSTMGFFNINLLDCQVFQEVYRQNSISKVAEEMFISRQSVTKSIQNLEDLMQHKLFVRTPQGTYPTNFANELLPYIARLLNAASELVKFKEVFDQECGSISLGVLGIYSTGQYIEESLTRFSEKTGINIKVVPYDPPEMMEAVNARQIDLAYTALTSKYLQPNICKIPLSREEFVLVTKKDSHLAELDRFPSRMLQKYQIVLHSRHSIQIDILQEYAQKNQLTLKPPVTTSDLLLVQHYTGKEGYIVILLKSAGDMITGMDRDLVSIAIDPPMAKEAGLIYRNDLSLNANHRAVIGHLKKAFQEIQPFN